jgi:antimicrobial peptide system SdpA family protein
LKNKHIIIFSGCNFLALWIITSIFFFNIPFNPIQHEYGTTPVVNFLIPQGWAFFTRNPREAQVIIYKNEGGRLLELPHKHSNLSNIMGLNRRASVIVSEMQSIKNKIPDSVFKNTKWNFQEGKFGQLPNSAYPAINNFANPILCGEYILVLQEVVPWAWSKNSKHIEMPAKVARIHIKCNEE